MGRKSLLKSTKKKTTAKKKKEKAEAGVVASTIITQNEPSLATFLGGSKNSESTSSPRLSEPSRRRSRG